MTRSRRESRGANFDERWKLTPNKAALLRMQKRPRLVDSSSCDEASGLDGLEGHTIASAASIWRDDKVFDVINSDVKLNVTRRYLRAARALYEVQFQLKRPAAILKMKPNLFGMKTCSTFDALAALMSPLRAHQVFGIYVVEKQIDDWTGLEIGLFEEAYERFGKDFYAIAEQIPEKGVRDTIEFYYIWKKRGPHARNREDGNLSDDFLPEPEPDVSSETLKLMDRLQKQHLHIQDFLSAARAMYAPQSAYATYRKKHNLSDFGLQRITYFQQGLKGISPLRASFVLDTWTPFEIRIFEVAIECYGKNFSRIAELIRRKTLSDVIAFYYFWKNDSHYQVMKNRWERKDDVRSTKKALAESKFKCA